MATRNSKSILSSTFDFNQDNCLDASLLFDQKKTSEEKFFNVILEKYQIMTRVILIIEKEEILNKKG